MSESEFNQQLTAYKSKLLYFAYTLTRNKYDAQDLYQDTMLRALLSRDKFDPSRKMITWLCTIMKNIFIDNYRYRAKHKTMSDDITSKDWAVSRSINYVSIPADANCSVIEINNVINKLKNRSKVMFKMLNEGYMYKEIAVEFNTTTGSVKGEVFHIRQKLMKKLKTYKKL